MTTTTKIITITCSLLTLAAPLFAAIGGREDSSNVLVWAFLGICGLIILLQMVPVASMAYGLIKGIFGDKKASLEDDLEAATSKYQ